LFRLREIKVSMRVRGERGSLRDPSIPECGCMTRSLILLAAISLSGMALGGCETAGADLLPDALPPTPPSGYAFVIFGADTVVAKVAQTPQQHQRGLMGYTHLPDGEGMLFVFEGEATRTFWMKDTPIPLDIAFLDRVFEVVDIQQMEPFSEVFHSSARPAMYALEVPREWFEAHGVVVGARAQVFFGPP
jgi:uncharacterized protein